MSERPDFLTALFGLSCTDQELNAFLSVAQQRMKEHTGLEFPGQLLALVQLLESGRAVEAEVEGMVVRGDVPASFHTFKCYFCALLILICPDWRADVACGRWPGCEAFAEVGVERVEVLRRNRQNAAKRAMVLLPPRDSIDAEEPYLFFLHTCQQAWAAVMRAPEDSPIESLENQYEDERCI